MREILFRGKQTVSGEWVYGSLITETNPFDKDIKANAPEEFSMESLVLDGHIKDAESKITILTVLLQNIPNAEDKPN